MTGWRPALVIIALAANVASAHGQTASPPQPGAAVAQTADASTPPSAAGDLQTEYVDRLIDGGALEPLRAAGGDGEYDTAGPPRYLKAQAVVSGTSGAGAYGSEDGLNINAGIDLPNYGAISLQGVLRAQPFGGSLALLQRGMPFAGGWSANNSVGDINSPEIDLARTQYRFYLPTFPIAGGSSEWLRVGGLQLQAAAGEPGLFNGLQLNGFQPLAGGLFTGAGQWAVTPGWSAGVQVVDARGVTTPPLTSGLYGLGLPITVEGPSAKVDAASAFASVAWRSASDRDQLDLVESGGNHAASATGAWFDGQLADGRFEQNYGAFWLQPNLSWGYLPISSDSEGVYYRAAYRSQQWLLDGGVDAARSISGAGLSGVMLSTDVRYQLEPASSVGGTLMYRFSTPDGAEGDIFAESRDRLGVWRLQLDGSFENDDDLARVTLDQTWNAPVGVRLMTSVFVTTQEDQGQKATGLGGALSGGGALIGPLSWDGSIGYDAARGSGSTGDMNANIGLTLRLTDGLSLVATYVDDRNQDSDLFAIRPIVPAPLTPVIRRSSAFLLSLRFETAAGSRAPVLGNAADGGAGSVRGRVFLDSVGDGLLHAEDAGAADVTVLLDGRFAVTTDAGGRFEFPLVASGPHTVTVLPDNLPLPWAIDDDGKRTVIVHAREDVEVAIAATRIH